MINMGRRIMDNKQIEKLGLIVASLKEFSYGLDRLDEISLQAEQGSATMRFYLNTLYEYVARYFLLYKDSNTPLGGNLYSALKDLGLEDYLDPIIQTLSQRIGTMDLQTILLTFRNKMITHSEFSFEPLEKTIYSIVDLRQPKNSQKYQQLIQKLFDQVKELYINLATSYPEAV
ncbi:hypothetical protein HKBW3S42_01135 [Candidatus Hakubella thermalkaliphila]|uniref:Uncharacterized protein n=1 Tax=Candidatus Hakubella thermalkaliphila TaxID=2754717 RepID=A0A6V8QH11_9ACTN|nr:hypothetical protein HKBW3S42_01135 [Candidatus Hakubella thermalkaliphila]GFP43700.1 hypothetical protein HKBW3C_02829 [Candidatus Hakubella thermalkaliphila]